ncbi:hypothetical protein EMCG_01713 [[Emmonsia] crescens]|uniref:Uncharacterized protein n=1 Tax=[Emmonsia] crescens TaxID=73230 RepID=A0A0G2J2B2_9EURO|nr:hypothetical protein EMCG_01713 [Emmonsia crescens UAMH 3008]
MCPSIFATFALTPLSSVSGVKDRVLIRSLNFPTLPSHPATNQSLIQASLTLLTACNRHGGLRSSVLWGGRVTDYRRLLGVSNESGLAHRASEFMIRTRLLGQFRSVEDHDSNPTEAPVEPIQALLEA